MAHEVETMMYVGETPWHGLGNYVGDEAVTADEAIIAAGLDWRVKKIPLDRVLFDGKNGETFEAHSEEHFAIVRNTDRKILGTCEGRYKCFTNQECFDFLDTVAGPTGELRYHTAGSLKGGKVVWMLAKLVNRTFEVVPGDVQDSFLLLSTSHDGSACIVPMFTPVRVVCANTLAQAMYTKNGKLFKIRHTGNLTNKIEQAQESLGLVVIQQDKYQEVCKYLAGLSMNKAKADSFLKELLPGEATRTENVRTRILELFEGGMGTHIPGVRGTAWGMYNAVTEYTNHEKNYRNSGKQKGKDTTADNRLHSIWYGPANDLAQKAQRILVNA